MVVGMSNEFDLEFGSHWAQLFSVTFKLGLILLVVEIRFISMYPFLINQI